MNKSPNELQKFITRLYMLPFLTPLWAQVQHPIDALFLKLSRNKISFTEILGGIKVVQLITVGAKTGRSHTLPLVAAFDETRIVLIASNFGQLHNPGWYHNLKKTPECQISINGTLGKYIARETAGEERVKYWRKAVSVYEGYEMYRKRAFYRKIPVFLLEPVK